MEAIGKPDRGKYIEVLSRAAKAVKEFSEDTPIIFGLEFVEDLLELLKDQEPKIGHWIILDFCANEGIYCSECHMKIFDSRTKPKKKLSQYCPHCGSRNEQFFKDGKVVFR